MNPLEPGAHTITIDLDSGPLVTTTIIVKKIREHVSPNHVVGAGDTLGE